MGVKGQKTVQNDKKILSVALHILGTIRGVKGKKMVQNDQNNNDVCRDHHNNVCRAPNPRNQASYDCHLWWKCVK